MKQKKAGRPKVRAAEKIVPLTVGVPAGHKKELLQIFKKLANERKQNSISDNSKP
jgi:hypothetical protein